MQYDENIIRNVVAQVLAEVGPMPSPRSSTPTSSGLSESSGRYGVFQDAESAVNAARAAFEHFAPLIADRKHVIEIIRRISIEQCEELGTMEMEETKIGRLEHKIEKPAHSGNKLLESRCWRQMLQR